MKLPAISVSRWALNALGDVYRLDGYVGIGTDSPSGLLGLKDSVTYIDVDTDTGEILFSDAVNGIKRLSQLGGGIPNTLLEVQDAVITILKEIDGYASDTTVSEHYNQLSQAVQDITSGLDGYALAPEVGSGADGYVAFFVGTNAVAGDNDLFWDRENNRLGIGTSTPITKLQVAGSISVREPSGSAGSEQYGESASATGLRSTALGNEAVASGNDSTSLGRRATSTASRSIAIGLEANYGISSVGTGSIAIGGFTQTPAIQATALADGAFAMSNGSIAIGPNAGTGYTDNTKTHQTVVGNGARGNSHRSIAIGIAAAAGDTNVDASSAMAIGDTALSDGIDSIAIGRATSASKNNSFAIGAGAVTSADNQGVFGNSITPTNLVNFGSLGLGTPSTASNFKLEVAGGIGPNIDDAYSLGSSSFRWKDGYFGPGSIHIISDSTENDSGFTRDWILGTNETGGFAVKTAGASKLSFNSNSNTWFSSGNFSSREPGGASNSEQFGEAAIASGIDSTALGKSTTANNTNTTAIGSSAQATASGNTAVGQNAQAVNSGDSTVIGVSALANGGDGVAIGRSAQSTANRAVAVGKNSTSSQSEATAVGYAAAAQQVQAVGIGAFSNANQIGATALGALATATGTGATSIGSSASASVTNGIAIGSSTSAAATNTVVIGAAVSTTSGATNATIVGKPAASISSADVTAIGHNTTVSTAARVVVIGHNAIAQSDDNTAVGRGAQVTGLQSTALGSGTVATGSSTVSVGFGASSTGSANTAIGHNSVTGSSGSNTAIGKSAQAGDSSNNNSVAIGETALATALRAIAVGADAAAASTNSIAIGQGASAGPLGTNPNCIAIGFGTQANGTNGATAVGSTATASAAQSTALGKDTVANQTNATAVGYSADATGGDSTAIGSQSTASNSSATGIGASVTASGSGSTAIGASVTASGSSTVAIGSGSSAVGNSSVAIGQNTQAQTGATNAVLIGQGVQTTNSGVVAIGQGISTNIGISTVTIGNTASTAAGTSSVAIGTGATATSSHSVAIGASSVATGSNGSTALGRDAQATGADSTSVGHGPIVQATNAVVVSSASMTVTSAGSAATIVGKTTGSVTGANVTGVGHNVNIGTGVADTTAIGANAVASTLNSTAIGASASAAGTNGTTAVGRSATASGTDSTAIGRNTIASATTSTAVGFSADATQSTASAFGANAQATGAGSTALGNNAQATGTDSTAVGLSAIANQTAATALGDGATASNTNATAGGQGATASGSGSTVYGQAATSVATDTVAIGRGAAANSNNATTVGRNSSASTSSITVGQSASSGASAVALGDSSTASGTGSISIGQAATTIFTNAFSIGQNAAANENSQGVFGHSTTPINLVNYGSFGLGTPTTAQNFKLEVAGDIGPNVDDAYSLGSLAFRWKDGYFGPGTLHFVQNSVENDFGVDRDWTINVDSSGRFTVKQSNDIKLQATDFDLLVGGGSDLATLQMSWAGGNHFAIFRQVGSTQSSAIIDGANTYGGIGVSNGNGSTTLRGLWINNLLIASNFGSAQSASLNSGGVHVNSAGAVNFNSTSFTSGPIDLSITRDNPGIARFNNFESGTQYLMVGHTLTDGYIGTNIGNIRIAPADNIVKVDGYIIPEIDDAYGLGSEEYRWKDIWLGPGSLHIKSTPLQTETGVERDWIFGLNSDGDLTINQDGLTYAKFSNDRPINLGTPAVTSHGLTTGSVIVGGQLEVESNLWVDGTAMAVAYNGPSGLVFIQTPIVFHSGEQSPILAANHTFDQWGIFTGVQSGNQIIVASQVFYSSKDFDHEIQGDPTIFIHSNTDPDVDNSQWLGLWHDKTKGHVETGLGPIVLAPYDGYVLPAADDAYSLGSQNFRWKDLWVGPNTLHIYQSAAENELGIERAWQIGINSVGDFFIRQSNDNFIATGTASESLTIGFGSLAFAGPRNTAIGTNSNINNVNGNNTGIGANTFIEAGSGVAIGANAAITGTGSHSSVVIGTDADTASTQVVAIGYNASIGVGFGSTVAIGYNSTISGSSGIAIGAAAGVAGSSAISIGSGTSGTGTQSIAIGTGGANGATNSVTFGYSSQNAPDEAVAIGANSLNSGVGNTGAIAIGYGANTNGARSIALGHNANTSTFVDALAIGGNAVATANNQAQIGSAANPYHIISYGNYTQSSIGSKHIFYNTASQVTDYERAFLHWRDNSFVLETERAGTGVARSISFAPADGYILPAADDAYSLGSPTQRWADIWLGPGSLHLIRKTTETETGVERDWTFDITGAGNLTVKQASDTQLVVGDNGILYLGGDIGTGIQLIRSSATAFAVFSASGANMLQTQTGTSLLLLQGGAMTYSSVSGWIAQSGGLNAWLNQGQDSVQSARVIGSADAAGEYAVRVGTKYSVAQNGHLSTLLQIGLDMDSLGTEVPTAEFYGDGGLALFSPDLKTMTFKHNGLDGYVQTDFGNLILSPANARVVPGGDAYGLGDFDNRWGDGYFEDLNTYGVVAGIVNIESIDSPYLARQDDHTIICDATGGLITVFLPSAGGANKGRIYNIKKIDAVNNVDIQASGLETIDGSGTVTLTTQYRSRQIQSDGANWHIIGGVF